MLTKVSFAPPDFPLFHYTSQQGLLGIIASKTIWATDIYYLNDAAEFDYAADLARDEILSIRKSTPEQEREYLDLIEVVLAHSKPNHSWGIFVCSFSEPGDQLSQWRGYCPDGSGFSIGFDFQAMGEAISSQLFRLARCIYDVEEQRGLIRQFLDICLDGCRHFQRNNAQPVMQSFAVYGDIEHSFLQVAPLLKHSKFSEEREWRLISSPKGFEEPQVKFRQGKSMIIPFFEFRLAEQNDQLPVTQLYVGPTPHPALSKASIESFLASKNVNCNSVKLSEVPYRAW